MDCSLPGSSVHGIFLAGLLEWVAISLFRESSQARHQTNASCIDRRILYHWATWEAHFYNYSAQKSKKTNKEKKKTWSSSWVMFFLSSKIQNYPGNKMGLTVKIYPEWSLLSLPSLLPLLSIMLSVIFAVVSWSVSFFLCLLSCNPLQCVLKKTASLVILQCELYHVL